MSIQSSTSDLAILRTLTGQINTTQRELYTIQKRATADFKYENYYDMDPILAEQSIYVEDLLRKNTLTVKSCDWSENLLFMQEASLKRFTEIIESGKKLVVQGYNDLGPVSSPEMAIGSKGMLARIEDELLTEYFGMNIWNGSRTNESPFNDNDLVNGTLGNNYYLGDNFKLSFYIDDYSVEFGDRANLQCFRDLIQALQIMRDSQNPTTREINKTDIENASALLDSAEQGIIALLQGIGNAEQAVIAARENAQQSLDNLSEMFTSTLNGMSEEARAINLIDAAAVQRKMGYILPIAMKYLKDMSIVQYL